MSPKPRGAILTAAGLLGALASEVMAPAGEAGGAAAVDVPPEAGTIAEILRDSGYNTFAVGKYGVTPDEDATDD